MIRFVLLPLAALAAGFFAMTEPVSADAPSGCWKVFLSSDQAGDYPDEILCAGPGKAQIRESMSFGEMVIACSRVTAESDATAARFAVDLSRCEGNLPTHVMVCPLPMQDENHCALDYGNEQGPAVLVRTN